MQAVDGRLFMGGTLATHTPSLRITLIQKRELHYLIKSETMK